MLTDQDIIYSLGKENLGIVMAIAIGIDGSIIHTMPTFTFFYELIKTSDSIECSNEDCSIINFIKDNQIVESLQTTQLLGSLLASNPDVFELMRRTEDNGPVEPSSIKAEHREVMPGWSYNQDGIIAPEGWTPRPVKTLAELQEEFNNRNNK